MAGQEALAFRPAPASASVSGSMEAAVQGRANSFQPQGLGPNPISLRPILPRCASRTGLMVAAQAVSLGWRANAGLLRAPAMAAMSLSTQAQQSTSPKPGFAPGAPAPGTPAAAPPAPPPKPPAGGVPPPPPGRRPILPGPEKELPKSKWSALGWAIPLIGLPVLAAAYNYQQEFDKEWDAKVAQALKEVRKLTQPNNKKTTTAPASPASAPAPTGAPATATAPSPSPLPPSAPAPPPQPAPAPTPAAAPPSATPPSPAPAPADAAPAPSPRSLADSQQPAAAAAPTASTEAAEKPVADSPAAAPLPAADGKDVASRGATEAAATPAAAPAAAADAGADAILQAAAAAPPAATAEGGGVAAAAAAPAPAPASAAATAAAPAPSATSIAAAAAAAVALLEPSAVPSAPLPAEAAQLGLDASSYDLSAVGLVRHAVSEAGQGVVDWAQWPERYAQAVADSRLVFEALRAVASHHSKELDKVRAQAEAHKQRAEQLQAEGEAAVSRFKALLRQYQESTKELLEIEVRQAEKRTHLTAQQARVAETKERGAALEELRVALGALSLAHETRVRQAAASQAGHALAAGAAALAAAADSGAPLEPAAAALRPLAGQDAVVGAVVEALPAGTVPTRAELTSQFRRLRRDLSALSHLPDGRAGVLAVAVARLAAILKADEHDAVRALDGVSSGGVDAALARADQLLADGRLPAAAELLAAALDGTAAAALAADWVEAARRRAAAEAAVAALNAHAAAMWASLA